MVNKRKKIIFIYEGVKTEENLLNNMVRIFFSSKTDVSILNCPADGNIYMLWTRLKKDEFETNVIDVLKEMSSTARVRLEGFKASDFSEIYLFFDYDGHNDNIPKEYRKTDILEEMLHTFNNETELGKLYVSYPMIESMKEIECATGEYRNLYLSLDEIADYKQSFFHGVTLTITGILTEGIGLLPVMPAERGQVCWLPSVRLVLIMILYITWTRRHYISFKRGTILIMERYYAS